MSLHWSSADSSRHQDESALTTSSTQHGVAGPSQPRPSGPQPERGLQAIGDFDFETLVQLLGTTTKEESNDETDVPNLRDIERSQDDISQLSLEASIPIPVNREEIENPAGKGVITELSRNKTHARGESETKADVCTFPSS